MGHPGRHGRPEAGRRQGADRGRAPVERGIRRDALRVHEHDQQPRRRDAPRGFQERAHPGAPAVRRREQPDEGAQGNEPLGRRRPRGAHGGDLGQGPGPQVLLADQGQARFLRGQDVGAAGRLREVRLVPRGASARRAPDHRKDRRIRAGPRGGEEGPRPRSKEGRARLGVASRKARGLPGEGSRLLRDLHRGGRLGRRLRQAGAEPAIPGDPAAPRQDPERREGPPRQDALLAGDSCIDHGARLLRSGRNSTSGRPGTTRSSS